MMRWDVINHLIKKNNYKSYLEIGYYKGWSFDRVDCKDKTAIDPFPSKTPEQEMERHGIPIVLNSERGITGFAESIFKETSDEFFTAIPNYWKWDIIFIDGLHSSPQVDKDIQNSLKHLSPGGTIVMHDVNPPTELHTTTGTPQGEWCGDVYKSFIKFRTQSKGYQTYVIDTDYGVGIIKPNEEWDFNALDIEAPLNHIDWKTFDKNRGPFLGLTSVNDFLKYKEPINQEVNV